MMWIPLAVLVAGLFWWLVGSPTKLRLNGGSLLKIEPLERRLLVASNAIERVA